MLIYHWAYTHFAPIIKSTLLSLRPMPDEKIGAATVLRCGLHTRDVLWSKESLTVPEAASRY